MAVIEAEEPQGLAEHRLGQERVPLMRSSVAALLSMVMSLNSTAAPVSR